MTFLKVLFSLGISLDYLGCTKTFGSITFLGLDHYCRTAFTHLIQQILFKTKDAKDAVRQPSHPLELNWSFMRLVKSLLIKVRQDTTTPKNMLSSQGQK